MHELSLIFLQTHPRDAARALERFEIMDIVACLQSIPVQTSAGIMMEMPPSLATGCLAQLDTRLATGILENAGIAYGSLLLRRMHASRRNQLLDALPTLFSNMLKLNLRYPSGTVGRVMNTRFFSVHHAMLAEDVLNAIRHAPDELQDTLFIIDNNRKLAGLLDFRDLLTAGPRVSVARLMHKPAHIISARSDLASVRNYPEWRRYENLPVVDHENSLIGVLDRDILLETVTGDTSPASEQEELASTVLNMAEILWHTCTGLFAPDLLNKKQR